MGWTMSSMLSIAAFGAAVWIIYYGLSRLAALKRDLCPLEESLRRCADILSEIEAKEEFLLQFGAVDARLRALPVLGPRWADYVRTLIVATEKEAVVATRPASDFFNESLPYRPEVGLRAHESIPNQLVGIGLLFTFIGLFLSLVIASSGMSGDFDTAKASLINLLAASAMKFVTSIAAIFTSLLFTRSKNKILADVGRDVDLVCAELERLTVSTSVEALADETRTELTRQTELLQGGNQELAKCIAAEMNLALRTSLKDAIAPVATEINTMAGRLGDINETAMRYMVDRFTKELGGAAREHSQAVASLLDQVARAVAGVPERIDQASTRFASSITAAATRIDDTFEESGTALSNLLRQTSTGVRGSAESLKVVGDRLSALVQQLDETNEGLAERLETVEAATNASVAGLSALLERLEQATASMTPLGDAAAQFQDAADVLQTSVSGISELNRGSEETQQRASAAAETLVATVQSFETGMRGLDSALADVFSRLGGGLDDFTAKTERAVTGMDHNLATAVDRLRDVVSDLTRIPGRQSTQVVVAQEEAAE